MRRSCGPLVTTLEQLRCQFYTEGKADFWDHRSEAQAREHVRSDPDRFAMTDTDPRASLQKLFIPGLWLYGGSDVSIPTGLSIERLQALTASGKPFEYRMFPEAAHNLSEADALPVMVEWIRNTVQAKAGASVSAR